MNQSVIDHIRATTPKSYLNRRRRSRTSRYLAISAGILIALAAITLLSA